MEFSMPAAARSSKTVFATPSQVRRIRGFAQNTNTPATYLDRKVISDHFVHAPAQRGAPAPSRNPFVRYIGKRYIRPGTPATAFLKHLGFASGAWQMVNAVDLAISTIGQGPSAIQGFDPFEWKSFGPFRYTGVYSGPVTRQSQTWHTSSLIGQAISGADQPWPVVTNQPSVGYWIEDIGLTVQRFAHFMSFVRRGATAADVNATVGTFPIVTRPVNPLWEIAAQPIGRQMPNANLQRAVAGLVAPAVEPIPSYRPAARPSPIPGARWRPVIGGGYALTYSATWSPPGSPPNGSGGVTKPGPGSVPNSPPGPAIRPSYPVGPRPPKPWVKEKKTRNAGAALMNGIDVVSEYSEIVDAFYDALPKKVKYNARKKAWREGKTGRGLIDNAGQYGIDGADWKARAVWENWDKVDARKAAQNVIDNWAKDRIYGAVYKGAGRRNVARNTEQAARNAR